MENQPSIEQLLNIIRLQESALEYYAIKKNYSGAIDKMPILKDRGQQATFALEQSKKIREFESDMVEQLKEVISDSETLNLEEGDTEETINRMNNIKNIFKNFNG